MLNLSNKMYDVSKKVITIGFPAFATLYSALSILWGFGYVAEVVGTLGAVATFGGVILGVSTNTFQSNHTIVPWTEESSSYSNTYNSEFE